MTAPSQVRIDELDPATVNALNGVGIGFQVHRADGATQPGPVQVTADYSGFSHAFGAAFADRLRLVRLPGCALSRPGDPACTAVPEVVPAANNPATGLLTAELQVAPEAADPDAVYVLATTAAGASAGDFRATDQRPSGAWSVGLGSGSFDYSYPIPMPPSVGGKAPDLSLTYDSGSVDGFTNGTNAQAGWVGLGWDLSPGFIERKYRACSEDVDSGQSDQASWGDMCWESPYRNDGEDNDDATTHGLATVSISLGGHTDQLIRESSGVYRLENDPGWRVEHKSGGPNDDNTGEYWVVYSPDGTQYRFGYGQDGGGTADHSNWTLPVVGDDSDEPCHATYPASCRQTWRWNLDRIVDPGENSAYLYWVNEGNFYKRFASGNILAYDRGGHLAEIDYGTNANISGEHVAAKAVFSAVNRCTERIDGTATTCPTIAGSPSSYPDVPTDLICSSTSCGHFSPSFFTTTRLDQEETFFWDDSTSTWLDDKLLRFGYKMPNPTGLTDPVLWLNTITPVGEAGDDANAITLPPVNLDSVFLVGRVDYDESAGVPKMFLPRIAKVFNGLGGETDVSYGHQAPCPDPSDSRYASWLSGKNGHWDTNTDDCYPVPFTPEGGTPGIGIFHKYLTTEVDDVDNVGGTTAHKTVYEYDLSNAAWAHNREYEAPQSTWTWNEWRGYGAVRVTEGASSTPTSKSVTTTTFFRGMNGDVLADGSHKTATRTDYEGNVWDDDRELAGQTLQVRNWTMTVDDPDPGNRSFTEVTSQRDQYSSAHAVDGPGARNAHLVVQTQQNARTRLDDGSFRETEKQTRYDTAYGLPLVVADFGQVGVADNTCTQYTYDQNTDTAGSHFLLDYPETIHTNAGDPDATTGNCLGTLLSQTVNLYDGKTSTGDTTHPIFDGNLTETDSYTDATHLVSTKRGFDSYGRVTSETDPRDKTTTTSYNPAVGFPVSGITVTDPLDHTLTTFPSRHDGEANKVTDVGDHTTTVERDALRRTTKVWLPTESTDGDPSYAFSYFPGDTTTGTQPTSPPETTTQRLQSGSGDSAVKLSTVTYLDGLGRTREVQTTSPAGGRMIVETKYDSRGLVFGVSDPIHDTAAAGSGLFNPVTATIPVFHQYVYDSMRRQSADIMMHTGAEQWRTSTSYHGDHTETVPPAGGKTLHYDDVDGNLTKVAEYDTDGTTHHDTTYTYDRLKHLTGITDASGDVTAYTYDLLGRRLTADDPDHGYSTTAYDPAGNPTVTVDAKGQKITNVYDDLGRRTQQWSGNAGTGTELAEWAYDTVAKGQLTSATAFNAGNAYTSTVTGYDARNRPTGKTISLPASEGALAGDYTYAYGYDGADHPTSITYPAAGGLPAETVTSTYTDLGLFSTLTSDISGGYTYLKSSGYTNIAQPSERDLGPAGGVVRTYGYDPATNRLSNLHLTVGADTANPTTVQDDGYSYDDAGDLTRVVDTTVQQSQCFTYDARRRLADAWTTTAANCDGGPAGADGNGPDPYKLAYDYDALGNITSVASGISPQITTGYTYPPADTTADQTPGHPNAVTAVGSDTYGYDANGALTSRNVDGVASALTWDPLGRLASVTSGGQSTGFVYDADGSRLIRRDPGSTTAYLDGMELKATGSTVTATRYYSADTGVVALRRSGDSAPTWLAADSQSSVQIAVDGSTGVSSRQRYLPYGAHRGGDAITATDRGFIGRTEDASTGLDQVGARYYDPSIGRFISTDPVQVLDDPQQRNPYAYAADNPTTKSDPTGLFIRTPNGHLCQLQNCHKVDTGDYNDNTSRSGRHSGTSRPSSSPSHEAEQARQARQAAEDHLRQILTELGGIAADVLGITDLKKCVKGGDIGSCAMTAFNGLLYAIGAGPEKILMRYLGHFREGWNLIKRIKSLISDGYHAYKDWSRENRVLRSLAKECNSFTPATRVLLANGKYKPIAKIKLGDKVLATDPVTGKTKPEPVVALITGHGVKHLTTITIDTDGNKGHDTATITATDHHPFWIITPGPGQKPTGHWVNVRELQPGEHLHTPTGHTAKITATRHYTRVQPVNNLTISTLHTYYVEAGSTSVLVHNSSCGLPDVPKGFAPQDTGVVADKIATHAGQRSIPGVADEDIPQFLEDTMSGTPGIRLRNTPSDTPPTQDLSLLGWWWHRIPSVCPWRHRSRG